MSCNRCADQSEAAMQASGVPPRQTQAAWASGESSPARCQSCGQFLSSRVPRCQNPDCGKGPSRVGVSQDSPFNPDDAGHRIAVMTDAEYDHDLTRRALQEADLGGEPDFRAFVHGDDPGIDPQALQERLGIAERWTTGRSSEIKLGLPDGRVVRATVRKTSGRGRNRGKRYLNLTVHGLSVLTNVGWKPGSRYYRLQIGKNAWKETDAGIHIVPRSIRHRDAVRAAYESGLRPAHIPDADQRRRYEENLRAYGLTTPGDAAPQRQDAAPPSQDAAPLFTPDDLIHTYTRAQAIEDGVLVDVSETAGEAGFRWPVALTAGVWALIEDIPPRFQGIQDVQGRLWDVLWMARCAARRGSGRETSYRLTLHHGRKTYATLKLVSGPGDEGEPVITIMLPGED